MTDISRMGRGVGERCVWKNGDERQAGERRGQEKRRAWKARNEN